MKQELPRRKRLRLPEHDYSHPGYYFVTVCTHLRQKLFQHLVGAHLCVRPPTMDSFLTMWFMNWNGNILGCVSIVGQLCLITCM